MFLSGWRSSQLQLLFEFVILELVEIDTNPRIKYWAFHTIDKQNFAEGDMMAHW